MNVGLPVARELPSPANNHVTVTITTRTLLMKKALALAATLVIGVSSVASAQATGTLKFTGAGPTQDGTYYTGPYSGQLEVSGSSSYVPVSLNCVDFFHEVSVGDVWTVNITQSTQLGTVNDKTRLDGTATTPPETQKYEEAAWLTTQYAGQNEAGVNGIQHAIWDIFGAPSYSDASSWLTLAANNYQNAPSFYILTPTDPSDPSSKQEFLVTTPEPGSMALFGTGLIGLVPMIRRRRKNA